MEPRHDMPGGTMGIAKFAASVEKAIEPVDVKELRREVDRLKRKAAAHASGEAIIKEAVTEAYCKPPDLKIPKLQIGTGKGQIEIPVLHLSDGQIGKVTTDYDSAKADWAIRKAVAATADIVQMRRHGARSPKLILLMGGDEVEGESIFPGQVWEVDSGVYEQAAKTAPAIYARAILSLLEIFKEIEVFEVPGNHGRNYTKGMSAHPTTNWDNVCHHVLRVMLGTQGKRITWHPNENWYTTFETLGHKHLLIHGDRMPWPRPGRKNYILDLVSTLREEVGGHIEYMWHGHHHVMEQYRLGRIVCFANGSPERRNDYAKSRFGSMSRPEQRLAFFNEKHGFISDYPLYLGD